MIFFDFKQEAHNYRKWDALDGKLFPIFDQHFDLEGGAHYETI